MVIAYVGNIGYPNTAPAVHIFNRAGFLNKCGHKVFAICDCPPDDKRMNNNTSISYIYMDAVPGKGKIRGVIWNLEQVFGFHYYIQTQKILKEKHIDAVILYEPNSLLFYLLISLYCKKNKIKLIVESTEWRDPKDYSGFSATVVNVEKNLQKKYFDRKICNTIAISEYLYKHYSKQLCNTILLPPIFPDHFMDGTCESIKPEDDLTELSLVYAGALSSKDYIDSLIYAIIDINSEKTRIRFDVIGPTKNEVEALVNNDNLERYGIFCHGRLSHEDTLKRVRNADFSVLLRADKRYAKAGVSTKFCEAMMLGVPSICTKVGGTDRYVVDGKNGFLVSNNEQETLSQVLQRILGIPRAEINIIKRNAKTTAIEHFTSQKYIDSFNEFFMKC